MTKRQKILWLCNFMLPQIQTQLGVPISPYGGWIAALLDELMKRGEVDVVILFPYPTEQPIVGAIGNLRYCSVVFDPCSLICSQETCDQFTRILSEEKPDVVHAFGTEFSSTLAMLQAAEKTGMLDRTIVNIQGLAHVIEHTMYASLPPRVQIKSTLYERITKSSLPHIKYMIAIRAELEKQAIRKLKHVFGRTDWDHACVYNINPNAEYHYCPEILRKSFYTCEWRMDCCDKHTIFAVAEHPIKGLPYLLNALPVILEKYPDACVRIAGSHDSRKGLGRLGFLYKSTYDRFISREIKQKGLTGKVQFLGSLDCEQMKAEYLKANVFVLPSVIENESNTLSEAKILGLPCVVSYVGGALSRIEHGVDGYQYPCAEPEMLAYYVCKVFENETKSSELGKHARENALALCNPEKVGDIVMQVYQELTREEQNDR